MRSIWKWMMAGWLVPVMSGLAQTNQGTAAPAGEMLTLMELLRMGGVLMYVLAGLSVLGLALIVYYAVVLQLRTIAPTEQAMRLRNAIIATLEAKDSLTPDLGGSGNTMGFAKAIATRL